jgi:hypothetical protein
METTYKWTMEIKGEIPFANKHGVFSQYGYSVATRICTDSVLDAELDEFYKMGGKVISFKREPAMKHCKCCNSEVFWDYYDFNHDCCMQCVENKAEEFTNRIQNLIESLLISRIINLKS